MNYYRDHQANLGLQEMKETLDLRSVFKWDAVWWVMHTLHSETVNVFQHGCLFVFIPPNTIQTHANNSAALVQPGFCSIGNNLYLSVINKCCVCHFFPSGPSWSQGCCWSGGPSWTSWSTRASGTNRDIAVSHVLIKHALETRYTHGTCDLLHLTHRAWQINCPATIATTRSDSCLQTLELLHCLLLMN